MDFASLENHQMWIVWDNKPCDNTAAITVIDDSTC